MNSDAFLIFTAEFCFALAVVCATFALVLRGKEHQIHHLRKQQMDFQAQLAAIEQKFVNLAAQVAAAVDAANKGASDLQGAVAQINDAVAKAQAAIDANAAQDGVINGVKAEADDTAAKLQQLVDTLAKP